MIRIGKILVLLVFFVVTSGTLLVPGSASADLPPPPIINDGDPELIDDEPDITDMTGDPDVGGDGLGVGGDIDIIPDDLEDLESIGFDPDDPAFWEAVLEYLLSMYYVNF
jgi:hypothetical protein